MKGKSILAFGKSFKKVDRSRKCAKAHVFFPAMILRLPQSNWTEDRSHPLNLISDISDMVLRDTYEMISSLLSSLVWCKNIAKIVKLQYSFF